MRLVCARCDAALVPAWTGPRCPRLNACGRGGLVERGGFPLPARMADETGEASA